MNSCGVSSLPLPFFESSSPAPPLEASDESLPSPARACRPCNSLSSSLPSAKAFAMNAAIALLPSASDESLVGDAVPLASLPCGSSGSSILFPLPPLLMMVSNMILSLS